MMAERRFKPQQKHDALASRDYLRSDVNTKEAKAGVFSPDDALTIAGLV
jgi:hypothetical protein